MTMRRDYYAQEYDELMQRIKESDNADERERLMDEAYAVDQERSRVRCFEETGTAATIESGQHGGRRRGGRRTRSPSPFRGRRGGGRSRSPSPFRGRRSPFVGRRIRRGRRGRSLAPNVFGGRRRGIGSIFAPLAIGGALGLGLGAALSLGASNRYDYRYGADYDDDYRLYLIRNIPNTDSARDVADYLRQTYGLRVRVAGVRKARTRRFGRRGRFDLFLWVHKDDVNGPLRRVRAKYNLLDWSTLGNSVDVVQDYDDVVF